MADNTNEYGNKLLNGEGLLHLVGTIKTEISNAGGGSVPTKILTSTGGFYDGNVSTEAKAFLFSLLSEEDPYSKPFILINSGTEVYKLAAVNVSKRYIYLYKVASNIKNGYPNYAPASVCIQFKPDGTILTYGMGQVDPSAIQVSSTYSPTGNYAPLTTILKYIKDNYAKSADVPSYTAGTGIDITNGVISATSSGGSSSLPADPVNDGTYFLTTTVSSGTATQTWTSIPNANGNNF